MLADRRFHGIGVFVIHAVLWTLVCGNSLAGPPPDAPLQVRALVGEYRFGSQNLILYERVGRLYVSGAAAAGIALSRIDSDHYETDDGQRLTIRRAIGHPLGAEWHGATFERYDLGAERVAAIRARVHANAQTLRAAALAAHPPDEPIKPRTFDLVQLVGTVPNLKLDVKYATTDNFIGLPLYSSANAFLQRPAAAALTAVARSLAKQGLGLVIFDGYRPWFVTKMFWDAVPPEAHVFVADPGEGSKHNRGCAIDLSLYDLNTGQPIEMTGRYDEMSPRSFANYVGGTARERWFRDLLRQEMQSRGFQVYPEEWWHFDYRDWRDYPIGNQAFEDLQVTTGSNYVAGLFFEEFSVGQKFVHGIRRTVTEADNVFFTALTHNPAPLHLDEEYCRTQTEFGQRVVNSAFTLGLLVGISVHDTTLGTTVANLGWDEVRFPQPVFHGDTIHAESEVHEIRSSKSRPENGIVIFIHRGFNQRNILVASCKRSALMLRKPK